MARAAAAARPEWAAGVQDAARAVETEMGIEETRRAQGKARSADFRAARRAAEAELKYQGSYAENR
jgi:hypothetical protein